MSARGSRPRETALIITTSQDTLGAGRKKTDVLGSEMTSPYCEFQDAGMEMDVASIRGGKIPIDPQSFIWFIAEDADRRYLNDSIFRKKACVADRLAKRYPSVEVIRLLDLIIRESRIMEPVPVPADASDDKDESKLPRLCTCGRRGLHRGGPHA